jgi:methyl coenzyme M reductase subunit D
MVVHVSHDNVLTKTVEGREIIKMYYQLSPVLVAAMENDEEFKEEVKEIMDQILPLVRTGLE